MKLKEELKHDRPHHHRPLSDQMLFVVDCVLCLELPASIVDSDLPAETGAANSLETDTC